MNTKNNKYINIVKKKNYIKKNKKLNSIWQHFQFYLRLYFFQ